MGGGLEGHLQGTSLGKTLEAPSVAWIRDRTRDIPGERFEGHHSIRNPSPLG